MNRAMEQLEGLLKELGTARSAGLLHDRGVVEGRSVSFPWQKSQTAAADTRIRVTAGWRRVVRGLAAAACIGLVLAGAWTLESYLSVPAKTPGQGGPLVAVLQDQPVKPAASSHDICDVNGDGVADGDDIQMLTNRIARGEATPQDAVAFARCAVNQ